MIWWGAPIVQRLEPHSYTKFCQYPIKMDVYNWLEHSFDKTKLSGDPGSIPGGSKQCVVLYHIPRML